MSVRHLQCISVEQTGIDGRHSIDNCFDKSILFYLMNLKQKQIYFFFVNGQPVLDI